VIGLRHGHRQPPVHAQRMSGPTQSTDVQQFAYATQGHSPLLPEGLESATIDLDFNALAFAVRAPDGRSRGVRVSAGAAPDAPG